MYSLIKEVCYRLNQDIGLMLYRLYSDIIVRLFNRTTSMFMSDILINYHICGILSFIPQIYCIYNCHLCHKGIDLSNYKEVHYFRYHSRQTIDNEWKCYNRYIQQVIYHTNCFKEEFGTIYDFKVDSSILFSLKMYNIN